MPGGVHANAIEEKKLQKEKENFPNEKKNIYMRKRKKMNDPQEWALQEKIRKRQEKYPNEKRIQNQKNGMTLGNGHSRRKKRRM